MISALFLLIFLSMIICGCYFFLRTFIVIFLSCFVDDSVAFIERYGVKSDSPPRSESPDYYDPLLLIGGISLLRDIFADNPVASGNHDRIKSISPPDDTLNPDDPFNSGL